ncbi:DUF421 domain-containing protein [Pseudalkalibacillus caeni]|uniref:DUF421 domain-containing protein n=1 Tax=Exobacillus caeni TaxID=2574798 RepID=A0A5R9EYH0_9BACL|nr:YetF domain-containing protein [Pseudalkalibacillus caeni]TLS36197.1 DUF421 domain-containing protein [Pseudalkalibacillus caeni]
MVLDLILDSLLVVAVGTFLLRIGGRRTISQMTISQTVIMISIGSLLIQPVSGKGIWFTFLVAAMLVLSLLILEYLQLKFDLIETIVTGKSVVVIENGTFSIENLKKLRLTVDNLELRLRQNGIENISDVQWATIEPSGQLGYELIERKKPATKEDIQKLFDVIHRISPGIDESVLSRDKNQDLNLDTSLFSEIKTGKNEPTPPKELQ